MSARTYKASSEDEVLGLGRPTICRPNIPFPLRRIELSPNHDSIESAVLLHTDYLVDVVEVSTQVFVVGVVVGPVPCVVYLGPSELVLRNFGVDGGAGVAVPAPGTPRIITGLENDCLQTAIAEGLEHEDTGYLISWWMKSVRGWELTKTGTHDQSIDLEVFGIWASLIGVDCRVVGELGVVFLGPRDRLSNATHCDDQVLQLFEYSSQKIDSLGCSDFFLVLGHLFILVSMLYLLSC
jgi:hypothetical protein